MGFGQYSAVGRDRLNKGEMLDRIARAHKSRSPVAKAQLVARNTLDYTTEDGTWRRRYHDTDVVTKLPDGTVTIYTGGWNTMTTRDRIRSALPPGYSVHTSRGSLFLANLGDGTSHEFHQRVWVYPKGRVVSDLLAGGGTPYDDVRPLVDRYIKALRTDGVPTETGGDPWVFVDGDSKKYKASDVLHFLDDPDTHEPYVFGTFIANALRSAGYEESGVGYWITQFNRADPDSRDRKLVCRSVRRYIRGCLGYAAS